MDIICASCYFSEYLIIKLFNIFNYILFRYNGRLFISWLQDVDDKWEKIKVKYKI